LVIWETAYDGRNTSAHISRVSLLFCS
jgi:hypothetical protein